MGLALTSVLGAAGGNVPGAEFKDRILPMEGTYSDKPLWGDEALLNRYADNGAEPETNSQGKPVHYFWGGNILKGDDGQYHLYVAGWDGTRAFSYWSNSDVYHLTSDTAHGPFKLTSGFNVGGGHNPTVFKAKDGTYVLYVLIGNKAAYRYTSKTLGDDWGTRELMPTNLRGRALSTGSTNTYSNWTFQERSDGSVYCMDRGGALWVSEDGLQTFENISDVSSYPGVYQRYYEDPVVWRDEFQYHMIVNHWNDKVAFYSRSKDGYHWVAESGTAYDPTVALHADGTREPWVKFECPRVVQDNYGRAIYLNMAVIDVEKSDVLADDIHSSKNIVMPLNPGMRMEVLNEAKISPSTSEIKVRIFAEPGFKPVTDLDMGTLRFGSHETVNLGGGAHCISNTAEADGSVVLVFNGKDTGLTDDEFAPKLIGRYAAGYTPVFPNSKAGDMCYGYARLKYIDYEPAYLSPADPVVDSNNKVCSIDVKNYGLKASDNGVAILIMSDKNEILSKGVVSSLSPYAQTTLSLEPVAEIPADTKSLKVQITLGGDTDIHTLQLTDIIAVRDKLSQAISEANALLGNSAYNKGKEQLSEEIKKVEAALSSFYIPCIEESYEALTKAINNFKFANASANRPIAINIENGDMNSLDGWDILKAGDGGDFHLNTKNNHNYNKLGMTPFVEAYNVNTVTSPNSISQTLRDMPIGKYIFEADVIAQSKTDECTGVSLFINDRSLACASITPNWSEHYSVEYTLTEIADITVGLRVAEGSNAVWVAMDNATLKFCGNGENDDAIVFNAGIENIYIKGSKQSANHYVTVERDYENYLNRITEPDKYCVWSKISDVETGDVWLYNVETKSFILPEGNYWKTCEDKATKVLSLEASGNGYSIRLSADKNGYMNAFGGFATSRVIVSDLRGFPVGGYSSGVWEFEQTGDDSMPEFELSNITEGLEPLKDAIKKLPRVAMIDLDESGITTYCAHFDVEIPAGVKAYTTGFNKSFDTVLLTEISSVIPANTPVILESQGATEPHIMTAATDASVATCNSGALTGALSAMQSAKPGCYVLYPQNRRFEKVTSDTPVAKNKCYVTLPEGIEKPEVLKIAYEDQTQTGIGALESGKDMEDLVLYNLKGRVVDAGAKGVVIAKGRKMLK